MDSKLFSEFQNPPCEYRGKPFWAWNGKLEPEELRRQIRVMKKMGLGGFFMHSRVGLDTAYLSKEWFECVSACIDESDKTKMEAWLYDEDRWPSGAGGGLVTKNPAYRLRHLEMIVSTTPKALKWDKNVLAIFKANIDKGIARNVELIKKGAKPKLAKGESFVVCRVVLQECTSWYNDFTYLDTMNHDAVKEFIKVTHESYRKNISKHFGKLVPGIFTDEPNYGHGYCHGETELGYSLKVPWTAKLPQIFKKRYGYDIISRLVELGFDVDGNIASQARYNYFDCITFLFVDAFARQIGEWCDKNNMQHTGHVLAEATLSSQSRVGGSAMRFYEYMQAPGMDILTEHAREYDTAKQVSSVAHQFGRKWRLTETYGCTGWDFSFAGHKAIGNWQAALGINLRAQHLSWYTMKGEAKRDYPAGIFYQSPWWESYRKVEDYFARIHSAMTKGEEIRDLLVVHPVESAWIRYNIDWTSNKTGGWDHPATEMSRLDSTFAKVRDSLLAENIDFDYGEEEIMSRHAKVKKSKGASVFSVAKANYKSVLVPPMLTMRSTTLALLKKFHAAGGLVVFAGAPAKLVDAQPSSEVVEFAKTCVRIPEKGQALARAVEAQCRRVSITDDKGKEIVPALHLLREDKESFYLFVCNTGHKASQLNGAQGDIPVRDRNESFEKVSIFGFEGCEGSPIEMNPDTGEILMANARRYNSAWEISTSLPALAGRIFIIPKKKSKANYPKQALLKTIGTKTLSSGKWDIRLTEFNNIVLDRPRYRIGKKSWKKEEEILRIDRMIRDELGIRYRGGQMVQPWAQEKMANPKTTPVSLSYSFDVATLPSGNVFLAIEEPKTFAVYLNGEKVSTDAECGWWTDRSLRKLPLPVECFRKGKNEILLECDYPENHSGLEIMYLLGDFGAKVKGTEITMTAKPDSLKLTDWAKQGLPFYSGSVCYEKTVKAGLKKGEKLFVKIPDYRGVAVKVLVDGKSVGTVAWQPNEIEITDFVSGDKFNLSIEVLGHRRNSHGPHHYFEKWPRWTGPAQYISTGKEWVDGYQLVPCGLMKAPKLIVRR